jgi:hypothetical protein
LRFLERLALRGELPSGDVWISDAPGDPPWRALHGEGLTRLALRLALAFPPEVIEVRPTPAGWQWTRFSPQGAPETGMLGKKPLWEPRSPLELWASPLHLPLARLLKPPRVLDYETVAQLDQRSLLLEDTPRRYRFTLPGSTT